MRQKKSDKQKPMTNITAPQQGIEAVLFDLDGTLMESAYDLTAALNQLLTEHQRPLILQRDLESILSLGSAEHIKLGFSIAVDHPDNPPLKERFLDLYGERLIHQCTTPLYKGIDALLKRLKEKQIPWGIVTNKYRRFAKTLIQHHQLDQQCQVLVTPEDVSKGKPSPEALLKACKTLQCSPTGCLYIGDHKRDIIAGKRASMTTIAAAYGYLDRADNPELWDADFIAQHPKDILTYLENNQWSIALAKKLRTASL